MTPDQRIARRRASWERLETLIDRAGGGIGGLSAAELRELGQLYRQAAGDLAAARRDLPDQPLASYLNGLVARGHGVVYRHGAGGGSRVAAFFRSDLPRAFRATWPATLAAALMLLLPAIAAFIITYRDPTLAEVLLPGSEQIIDAIRAGDEWWLAINDGPAAASAQIMTNNIGVTISAFAGGVLLGLYTLYILVQNGLLLGVVAGAAQRFDFAANLWGFVAAHAVVEFSVIFIAGGAGLQLGWSLLRPGLLSRRAALVVAARRAVLLLLGCAPLLVVAGLIEAFISPADLPLPLKVAVALGSGALLYTYLIAAGRAAPAGQQQGSP